MPEPEKRADPGSDMAAADRLKAYIKRRHALEDDREAINADLRELNKEMRDDGFDQKTLNKVSERARLTPDEVMTGDALLETYEQASGTGAAAGGTLDFKRNDQGVFEVTIAPPEVAAAKLTKATEARKGHMALAEMARLARESGS